MDRDFDAAHDVRIDDQVGMYTLIVATSLGTIAELWGSLQRAVGATERIYEIIDAVPEIPRFERRSRIAEWRRRIALRGGELRLSCAAGQSGARQSELRDRARGRGRAGRCIGLGKEHARVLVVPLLRRHRWRLTFISISCLRGLRGQHQPAHETDPRHRRLCPRFHEGISELLF